jgi:hypothetical protein
MRKLLWPLFPSQEFLLRGEYDVAWVEKIPESGNEKVRRFWGKQPLQNVTVLRRLGEFRHPVSVRTG